MKVLVLGAGKSGIAVSKLLLSENTEVLLYDDKETLDTASVFEKIGRPVSVALGKIPEEEWVDISYAVISPGIPADSPIACQCTAHGKRVDSEIEVAFRHDRGTVIGITGTNGKTTTTTLTGEIMKAHFGETNAFTVGNIGFPYTESVLKSSETSVSAVELSSFQLETVHAFHPHVSAILNITPDHLNRHHTMECYTAMKERVTENQTVNDTVVLNYEDERLRAFGENVSSVKVLFFSGKRKLPHGFYYTDGVFYRNTEGIEERLLTKDDVLLVGQCNYENILAALAISYAMKIPDETVRNVLKNFHAVPHRIEYTATVNGVKYYNDSKGTNVDAAVQGIRAMEGETVLIGGGYDKGVDFDDWIKEFSPKVKELILIGQTAKKIAETCERYGFTNYKFEESLKDAVITAFHDAKSGDSVLLSPACASWGMFTDFEQRGDLFKEYVRELEKE